MRGWKTCEDYWALVGMDVPFDKMYLSHDCCISCHDDRDEGYEMMSLFEDNDYGKAEIGEVCCAVKRAMDDAGVLP